MPSDREQNRYSQFRGLENTSSLRKLFFESLSAVFVASVQCLRVVASLISSYCFLRGKGGFYFAESLWAYVVVASLLCLRVLVPCYPVTLLPCYPVTLLPCYLVTLLPFYPVTLLSCYLLTLLPCYLVTLLPCYPVTLLPCYLVTLLLCYLVALLPCYPVNLLSCYPVTLLPCYLAYYLVTLLPCYPVTLLSSYLVTLLPCYLVILLPCYPVTLLPCYLVTLLPCYLVTLLSRSLVFEEQGWRSGESTRLLPMWPGFDSRTRRHMWVEFVVCSLLCSERFLTRYSGFPLSAKTNISKFQFDPECSSV